MISLSEVKESDVEKTLRLRLEEYGFEVLKMRTPGYDGVPDRMILMPRYSPGAPMFVEIKKPGKVPRALQKAVMDDWKKRGCIVLDFCSTMGDVEQICHKLIQMVMADYKATGGY